MKSKSEIPYFFNESRSGFGKEDFDLVSPKHFHLDNRKLTNILQGCIFKYENRTKHGIVFYFINQTIENTEDLRNLHIRIFSEDKADFYILKNKNKDTYSYKIIYAKTTPDKKEIIKKIPAEDEALLQTINKISIDTGAFWLYYSDTLKNAKISNIRNELVKVLSDLRDKLKTEIEDDIYVQALIDRTLFIKFLEDRHIINSYFYGSHIEYKEILKSQAPKKVNDLFTKVHKIFNNYLFDEPTIPDKVLTNEVLQIIQSTIAGERDGQLTLFDLKFDIIPVEAISRIYEIFFDKEERKKGGIFYTPQKLTDFIVNQTINKKGQVIDPACGSGEFLISAYKKLLKLSENEPVEIDKKIDFRVNLIKKYIFGIELKEKARRLTIFALYLSILEDLTEAENAELKQFLKKNPNYKLFKKNIGENIECKNTFEPNEFDNKDFDFIVGNPPWKKDFKDDYAEKYYNANKQNFSGKTEISQLFQHKAKLWEKENTRYGFVVNTSNFSNEYSNFQDFFYKNFTIEKLYEVSALDFFTSNEPAIVCIYTKKKSINNTLVLNVLKPNAFSKLFKSVLIVEDDNISIEQKSLINNDEWENIPLRNFLVGSDGNFQLINYLESNRFEKFEKYILKDSNGDYFIRQGVIIYSEDVLPGVFDVELRKLKQNKNKYRDKFYEKYTSKVQTEYFEFPFVKVKNIDEFIINYSKIELYLPYNISKLRRSGKEENYCDNRILITRTSDKFKAVYLNENTRVYPTSHINTLKLNTEKYYLYTAILNSKLIEYYLKVKFWQRVNTVFPRINQEPILQIPVPKNKNPEIVQKITKLSKQVTKQEVKFEDHKDELNNLIYNLYGIGIIEKQRINDFFIKDKQKATKQDLEDYANDCKEYLSDYIKPDTQIFTDVFDDKTLDAGISVVKIYFGEKGNNYPKPKKTGRALLFDLLKNTEHDNILTFRKRLYGKNTIYIIKDNSKKSWSLTKAADDAIAELNKINKHKSQMK